MNKCYFNILPRQSGKTTKMIDMFNKSSSSLIITNTGDQAHRIKKTLNLDLDNCWNSNDSGISSVSTFLNKQFQMGVYPYQYTDVFIDEYLSMPEKYQAELYHALINGVCTDTVHIFTSATKLINKSLLDLMCNVRKCELLVERVVFVNKSLNDQASYIMNNFMSDPRTQISVPYHDYHSILTPEQYYLTMGKFYDI